jgi:hypothetical protein
VDPENLYYTSVGGVLFDISQTTLIQYPPALAGNYSIPSGVAGIGAGAFRGCVNFTTETIPAGVTNIGDAAFDECINLTAFTVAPGNSFYSSAGGVLFDLNQATLIQYPAALAGNYAIPSTVTSIGDYAFDTCATLTNVTIPTGVTNISDHAFYACGSLTNAALPAGLANIGDFAFFLCSSLSNVAIPAGVTCIGQDAFAYCAGLTNATIANGVAAIGNSAFDNCSSLTSVTIPGSVTNIGNCAFYDCAALTNATIANGVISLGASAFSYCTSLAGVTIPASLTNIAQQAFAYCPSLMAITVDPANPSYSSLNGVLFDKSQSTLIAYPGGLGGNYTIPSTVTTLGDYAFYGCGGLVSVTIPAGVTNLGNCQFYDCFSLTNAIIGGGISRIGSNAFFFSSRLISVTFPASVYYIANAFNDNWTLTNLFFQGNPPAMGAAFGYWAYPPSPPMLYYLPGASGWSSTYDGYSTVLWNPLIQPGASGFGVKTNHFGFYITGTRNIPIVIEASTNLAGSVWTPLQTLRLTNGSVYFNDTYQPGNPARYYRIGSQ